MRKSLLNKRPDDAALQPELTSTQRQALSIAEDLVREGIIPKIQEILNRAARVIEKRLRLG